MKHSWESQPLRIWFFFFFGIKVTSTGPFMMDIYLEKSELVWIAHCWVWVFWVTLEVDKSVLELMSLWVRSFVLGIAKDSCRSNSAHYPLPLFNTLDSFPRTQMPVHFNKSFKSGNGNFCQKATSLERVSIPRYWEEGSFPQERALMTPGPPENDQSCVKSKVATSGKMGGCWRIWRRKEVKN